MSNASHVELLSRISLLHQNAFCQVWLFGEVFSVEYQLRLQKTYFQFNNHSLLITVPQKPIKYQAILRSVLIQVARQYLTKRLLEIAGFCQLTFNAVRIKEHRSKWGSCSSKKNINLNWRLILLPKPVIDYVLVHELMHLHEMNHSTRFWAWVGQYLPDYQSKEKNLREMAWTLHLYPNTRR